MMPSRDRVCLIAALFIIEQWGDLSTRAEQWRSDWQPQGNRRCNIPCLSLQHTGGRGAPGRRACAA